MLARRLVQQLGGDLDRVLGVDEGQTETPLATRQETGVELRQVAGLTAGASMRLTDGMYQFGQSAANDRGLNTGQPEEIGFSLTVRGTETWIETGGGLVTLDGESLTETTKVGDSVIEVGSARFVVAIPRRPERRKRPRNAQSASEMTAQLPPIEVPDLADVDKTSQRSLPSILGVLRGNQVNPMAEQLAKLVRTRRAEDLDRLRSCHPDPEEILYRAKNGRTMAWDRLAAHPLFAQVSIAIGDMPWRPTFDRPDRIPTNAADGFRHLLSAPSVPLTADLRRGPLGIVGSRPARLAVARHVMTSLATLSPPEALTLAVMADEERATDWGWADALPHNLGGNEAALPVFLVDGLHHLADSSIEESLANGEEFGCIFLGDDMHQMPGTCSSVLLIDDNGSAVVIDNTDGTSTMGTTPLGISADLAASAVQWLRTLATRQLSSRRT